MKPGDVQKIKVVALDNETVTLPAALVLELVQAVEAQGAQPPRFAVGQPVRINAQYCGVRHAQGIITAVWQGDPHIYEAILDHGRAPLLYRESELLEVV